MSWAIVIGVDEYGDPELALDGAVSDALRFRDWVVATDGGGVPESNLRLLLGPRDASAGDAATRPTKDNIVTAVNDVVTAAAAGAERLYFYFSGHGLTARVANRDEGALVTPGFDRLHTDHSLAIRSLTEFFETTPFADQFFFIDACRNRPWRQREFEIGRWPVPRNRDPGASPVQQFILYATSPGLTAAEVGWPDEAVGAFTDVLMRGLDGDGRAKAWSWERNCYEVRWERLATYVNRAMRERKNPTRPAPDTPAQGWPIQIPQDAGSRGVVNRDRDPLLAAPRRRFDGLDLTLDLKADPRFDEAEVQVLDAVGEPVATALKVPGTSVTFTLPPKTYAARALTTDGRVGRIAAPIELYEPLRRPVELRAVEPPTHPRTAAETPPDGTIAVTTRDPLATAEICDEAGQVVTVTAGNGTIRVRAGFHRVRHVGPEEVGAEELVVVSPGARRWVALPAPSREPTSVVAALTEALGGHVDDTGHVVPVPGAEPVAWPQPSTLVLAGLGAALSGAGGLERLGLVIPPELRDGSGCGMALIAVAGDGDEAEPGRLRGRIWPVGDPVPSRTRPLQPIGAGVAAHVETLPPQRHGLVAAPYWVSLERDGTAPTVAALSVLPGRVATFVLQVTPGNLRSYQVHPAAGPGPSSSPDRLRRLELLQRLLLSGRLDVATPVARELAAAAAEDPFAGCLAGYALLRLGHHEELDQLTATLIEATGLCDAFILRAEHLAAAGRTEAAGQAFTDAVNAGIPAFGEGLTRLVEGLRSSPPAFPRSWLVRHIFQHHARGSMWSAFTPPRGLQAGELVISAADIGYAG